MAGFEAAEVVEDEGGGGFGVGRAGDVRGDEDARVGPEGVLGGERLSAEDVEGGGGELAAVEGGDQVILDEVAAAAGVDEGGAAGERRKGAGVEDAFGFGGQR